MDSSRRALQTNGKLFRISFPIICRKPKKYSNKERGVNIDQCAMCYISLDLCRRALETNGKLFSNFEIILRINYIILKIIVAFGLCMRGEGGINFVLISTRSSSQSIVMILCTHKSKGI